MAREDTTAKWLRRRSVRVVSILGEAPSGEASCELARVGAGIGIEHGADPGKFRSVLGKLDLKGTAATRRSMCYM